MNEDRNRYRSDQPENSRNSETQSREIQQPRRSVGDTIYAQVNSNDMRYDKQEAPIVRNISEENSNPFPPWIKTIKIPRPSLDVSQ